MKRKNFPDTRPFCLKDNHAGSDVSDQTKDIPGGSFNQFLQSNLSEWSRRGNLSTSLTHQNNQTSFPVYYNLHEMMKTGAEFRFLEADGHGWMIASHHGPCFLYHASVQTALDWISLHPDCLKLLCIFDESLLQSIQKQYRLDWQEKCFQFVISDSPNSEELPNVTDTVRDPGFCLQPASLDNLSYLQAYYELEPEETIIQSIMNDRLFMVLHDQQIAGFIGIHPEGSIGMLFIHPDFRHKKLASKAELMLASLVRKRNLIPVFDVFKDNSASLRLQKSLKGTEWNGFVWWLSQKSEDSE